MCFVSRGRSDEQRRTRQTADRQGTRRGESAELAETEPGTKAARVKKRLTSRTATIASLVIAVVWTIPTFGLLVSSFRPAELIRTTGWWTIFQNPGFTLENYATVLFSTSSSSPQLGSYIVNSIAITLLGTLITLVFAAMAAYAFAWIRFKWVNWLFIFVFALQIIPLQMSARAPAADLLDLAAADAGMAARHRADHPRAELPSTLARTRDVRACRWPSSCCTTSSPISPPTSSRRRRSTGQRTGRSSSASCCRSRPPRSRRSRSSSSSGSGTTCWSR